LKLEPLIMEPSRCDVPTIKREFGIGSQNPVCSHASHPRVGPQSNGYSQRATKLAHELSLRDWIRRRGNVRPVHALISKGSLEQTIEVRLVNPADSLPS